MDAWLDWNSDLLLTPNGDVQAATGWDEVRQRIIRRLITNPAQQLPDGTFTLADDIWNPDYGIGLGTMVGQSFGADFEARIERRIAKAVLEDSAVDSTVPPSVKFVRPQPDSLWIVIGVTLVTGKPGTIALKVG